MINWKKIKSEVVHQNPFWIYRQDVFEVEGCVTPRDYYYVETPGSVMAVPLLSDGRIVMVQTFRCLQNKYSVEFPGGAVKDGQTFEQAAHRKLQEEAGLTAQDLINIGEFCPFNGISTELCKVYLAKGLERVATENNPQEPMELMPRRIDEIENLIKHNQIWDGQSLAVWALVRPHLTRDL
jgi:8-oxo-dGTP pyrophosphatase MutT (NUDIX family)